VPGLFIFRLVLFSHPSATTVLLALPLHDALPILSLLRVLTHFASADEPEDPMTARQVASFDALTGQRSWERSLCNSAGVFAQPRSEEHTSELQSRENLVCRLLLEKKKTKKYRPQT